MDVHGHSIACNKDPPPSSVVSPPCGGWSGWRCRGQTHSFCTRKFLLEIHTFCSSVCLFVVCACRHVRVGVGVDVWVPSSQLGVKYIHALRLSTSAHSTPPPSSNETRTGQRWRFRRALGTVFRSRRRWRRPPCRRYAYTHTHHHHTHTHTPT